MLVMLKCCSVTIYHVIRETEHGKEVFEDLNAIAKKNIHQLMSNVQLLGSKTFDSKILMHFCTQNSEFSLAKELQKHLSKKHWKHGVIDQGTFIKIDSKIYWTDREYHFKNNIDIAHK